MAARRPRQLPQPAPAPAPAPHDLFSTLSSARSRALPKADLTRCPYAEGRSSTPASNRHDTPLAPRASTASLLDQASSPEPQDHSTFIQDTRHPSSLATSPQDLQPRALLWAPEQVTQGVATRPLVRQRTLLTTPSFSTTNSADTRPQHPVFPGQAPPSSQVRRRQPLHHSGQAPPPDNDVNPLVVDPLVVGAPQPSRIPLQPPPSGRMDGQDAARSGRPHLHLGSSWPREEAALSPSVQELG
ncbi:hypothetical protein QBC39DRAFT_150211 [Podospora conica]|nr:hypothetical protein QBC39DRAFT_150211 [Schizothecium conicum]